MKCRHCGKEYEDSFSYCPYCAEPKPVPQKEITIADQIKEHNKWIWVEGLGVSVVVFVPIVIAIYVILLLCLFADALGAGSTGRDMTADLSWFQLDTVALIALGMSLFVGLIYIIGWYLSPRRAKMIEVQFSKDKKSICPVCGSHSVSLGRKGYDWNKGFWYRMFRIKGGYYLAGMDSRRVTAHCQNCGHSWETNEEWLN